MYFRHPTDEGVQYKQKRKETYNKKKLQNFKGNNEVKVRKHFLSWFKLS